MEIFASSVFHRCNAKTQKTQICVTGPQCVKLDGKFKRMLCYGILGYDNVQSGRLVQKYRR
jgi:hypothetical protein